MKKGFCLGTLPGDSVEDRFKLGKDAGFDGIEIGTLENDGDRQNYKMISNQVGIDLFSVMNAKHWSLPLSHPDQEVRTGSAQGVIDSIETAAVIGASTVLLVPAVVNPEISYEDAYSRSQAEIKNLIPVSEEKNVKISIENVWNKFLLSPIEFVNYIDEFESDCIGAYFDVGNILLYGYPQHWIRSIGNRMDKVHIKGFNTNGFRWTGLIEDCSIDWNSVMAALSDISYDGYITAELGVDQNDPIGGTHKISQDMDRIIAGEV